MPQLTRRARHVAAALALACLPFTFVNANASAAPAGSTASTSGPQWSVTRVAGGFRVALHLDRRLPVTASAPTLSVDGANLGPATESADGTSLSLLTTDPSVAHAATVTTDAFGSVRRPPGADLRTTGRARERPGGAGLRPRHHRPPPCLRGGLRLRRPGDPAAQHRRGPR
ncbi:hypothetical protein ACFO3J_09010 [Streptomyces polygonati]|uniref:Uncharacterized protein n=1 Tax=Streptomyces polygonati TaxID=1617087 RepID=A0ABV8HLE7_9ACTN